MGLSADVSSASIAGSVHPYEDRILVDRKRMLYAVADGVTISSRGSGAVAAELAVELLRKEFAGDILGAVERVNEELTERRSRDLTIGETTLTAACLKGDSAEVANVGDSPALLLRERSLIPLFQEDRDVFGYITQVIGSPGVQPHLVQRQLHAGDYLLLASDGVAHVLLPHTLSSMIAESVDAKRLAEAIIKSARDRPTGYDDDKSVITLKILQV